MSNESARGIPSGGNAFKDLKERAWALKVEEMLEILIGTRGNVEDQAMTWRKMILLGFAFLKDEDLVKDLSTTDAFSVQIAETYGWNGMFAAVDETALKTVNVSVVNGEVQGWAGAFTAVDTATNLSTRITVSSGLCSPDGAYAVVNPINPRATVDMTITLGRILTVI